MAFNRPFSVAIVDASETTFSPSHLREDYQVFDVNIEEAEGDFCNMSIEIENPQIGLLAPGRPLWIWIAWNPNWVADYPDFDSDSDVSDSPSSDAIFADMVPLFFGRVQGVPEDFIGETSSPGRSITRRRKQRSPIRCAWRRTLTAYGSDPMTDTTPTTC
jgi:hypothetical protein